MKTLAPARVSLGLALCLSVGTSCVAADEKPKLSSDDPIYRSWPANPEYQRSRIDMAVQNATRLLNAGEISAARRRLVEMPAQDLEDGHVYMLLARICMLEGRPGEVETNLDKASSLLPMDPAVDLMRATYCEVYGNWGGARMAYAEAARKGPDAVEPIVAQARVLLAMDMESAAVKLLQQAMASRPLSGELLRTSGFVHLAAGLHDEAARCFREAQDLLPSTQATTETMFLALARAGRYADVVALAANMTSEQLSSDASFTLGHAALLSEQPQVAVKAFQDVVNKDRDEPEAWMDLARAHYLDLDNEAAFEALSKVLQRRPEHVGAIVLLGHIRVRVGQYQAAMSTYREAAKLGADGVDLAPVMFHIVDALEAERTREALAMSSPLEPSMVAPAPVLAPQGAATPSGSMAGSRAGSLAAVASGTPTRAADDEHVPDTALERDPLRDVELLAGNVWRPTPKPTPEPAAPAPVRPEPMDLADAGPAAEELPTGAEAHELPELSPVLATTGSDPASDEV